MRVVRLTPLRDASISVLCRFCYSPGSAVSARYAAPFAFTGTLHEGEIVLPQRQSRSETEAKAASEMSRQ